MEKIPVKVLQVLGTLNCGGAENFIMNIYRNIDKTQVQFDFVIHTEQECFFSEEVKKLGATIYCAPRYKGYNHIQYIQWWNQFLKQHSYDVVHGHIYSVASIYLRIARTYGIQTISHSHSSSNGTGLSAHIKNFMQRGIGKVSDRKLACGIDAGNWLYGKNAEFTVVNNGIETEKYQYNEKTCAAVKSKLQLESDFIVGHVGRFDEVKNHTFLIQAFQEVKKSKPNAKLLLVGDGPLKEEIQNQAQQLGILKDIVFTGIRKDVNQLLMAMDVFVMPSIYEGLPVVLVEAQASGLCCVVSTAVDMKADLTNKMKFLSLEQDISDWANAITTIYDDKNREIYCDQVNELGYGITNTVKYLEMIYRKD